MNKMFLIFKHEFLHTVKRKGFIIMTLIVPLLALLAIGVFRFVSGVQKSPAVEEINIGYVDEVGMFRQYTSQGNIMLIRFASLNEATKSLVKGDVKEYFVIPSDYMSTGLVRRYAMQRELKAPAESETAIRNFLLSNLLADKVPPAMVKRVEAPLNLVTVTLTQSGTPAPEQGGIRNFIIPGVFSLLFALSMIFSSTYMIQGLGEEKENRLMEILVSSASPGQLLTGKVLGLGTAGLVQVAVWVVSLPLLFSLASSTIGGYVGMIRMPTNFLILAIVYFILGYLLFAVVSASVGAISPTTQEAQQLSAVYTLFALIPLWFLSLLMTFPNSPVWTILTIFPFTAPVLVIARVGLSNIPTWELIVSIAVLVLSVMGGLLISAKVFQTYLLRYGKRPKFQEIISSLKSG